MYIIYIKWTVFVNFTTTKSAQHAHARMIAIIVEMTIIGKNDLSLNFFQQYHIYI